MMEMVRTEEGVEEVLCPSCGTWQPRSHYNEFTIVPRYMASLTPVLQCLRPIPATGQQDRDRTCRHIFAVTEDALRMRQSLLDGVTEVEER